MYCSPSGDASAATEFSAGPISVSNSAHAQYTVVTVREEAPTPGFLLEIASVLTGLNVEILQGVIQGCTDCGEEVPQLTTHIPGGRLFQFWVRDRCVCVHTECILGPALDSRASGAILPRTVWSTECEGGGDGEAQGGPAGA